MRDLTAIVARLRAAGCVYAEDEAAVLLATAADAGTLATMVARRVDGHPLEQVVGWAEFCGVRVSVLNGVFVPRQRSALLVREAAAALDPAARDPIVVDLCCGSGALGVALAARVPGIVLHCADVDPRAVRCARANVAHLRGAVYEGDLYAALPAGLRGRVSVILANVPYVPTGDVAFLPAEAREHEPRHALDGGPDGLDVLRRVAADAARWLAPGGALFLETSVAQAPVALAELRRAGLAAGAAEDPDLGATVVRGRLRRQDAG
ncbi:MAG TPA: putative protein N(5)-glutamine methyltransferase [Pilimelia sp.]|nr:putative protein N(5)-glutamine methyltransferase [Pilimelia sp.]